MSHILSLKLQTVKVELVPVGTVSERWSHFSNGNVTDIMSFHSVYESVSTGFQQWCLFSQFKLWGACPLHVGTLENLFIRLPRRVFARNRKTLGNYVQHEGKIFLWVRSSPQTLTSYGWPRIFDLMWLRLKPGAWNDLLWIIFPWLLSVSNINRQN